MTDIGSVVTADLMNSGKVAFLRALFLDNENVLTVYWSQVSVLEKLAGARRDRKRATRP